MLSAFQRFNPKRAAVGSDRTPEAAAAARLQYSPPAALQRSLGPVTGPLWENRFVRPRDAPLERERERGGAAPGGYGELRVSFTLLWRCSMTQSVRQNTAPLPFLSSPPCGAVRPPAQPSQLTRTSTPPLGLSALFRLSFFVLLSVTANKIRACVVLVARCHAES